MAKKKPTERVTEKAPVAPEAKTESKKSFRKPEKVTKKPIKEKPVKPEKPAPRGGNLGAQISFICSECYEEFFLSASQMKETVTCPECLHVGKKPQEDFLKTVHLHKGGEKKSLTIAVMLTVLMGLFTALLIYVNSPYARHDSGLDADSAGTYSMVLGGLMVLVLIGGIWLVARYEKNRWEVYF